MIEVKELQFHYRRGEFSLEISELSIPSGSTVAVIGPSGTGKTTLLNLVAGILQPDFGSMRVKGELLGSMDDRTCRNFRIQNMGLVFQEFELLEYLSVIDNVLLPYRINSVLAWSPEVRQRAEQLLEEVGLADKRMRNIRHLSQGERQRVALCRSLITEPSVLLCDEPTGNLDPTNRDHVLDILFNYIQSREVTMVSVTHDHEILDRFDRVIDTKELNTKNTHRRDWRAS